MALVVLDGELAVPCNPKSAYAGSKILHENRDAAVSLSHLWGGVDLA